MSVKWDEKDIVEYKKHIEKKTVKEIINRIRDADWEGIWAYIDPDNSDEQIYCYTERSICDFLIKLEREFLG